jgi:hypothetical protein
LEEKRSEWNNRLSSSPPSLSSTLPPTTTTITTSASSSLVPTTSSCVTSTSVPSTTSSLTSSVSVSSSFSTLLSTSSSSVQTSSIFASLSPTADFPPERKYKFFREEKHPSAIHFHSSSSIDGKLPRDHREREREKEKEKEKDEKSQLKFDALIQCLKVFLLLSSSFSLSCLFPPFVSFFVLFRLGFEIERWLEEPRPFCYSIRSHLLVCLPDVYSKAKKLLFNDVCCCC